jgi:hypothetical protein
MTTPDTLPPDLAELGELLRENPPRPSQAWAHRLDARAAAGFPPAPRAARRRRGLLRPGALLPALGFAASLVLVVGIVTLAANRGPGTDVPVSSDAGGGGASSGREASPEGATGRDGGAQPDAASRGERDNATPLISPVPPGPGGGDPRSDRNRKRKVERTAALTLAARPRDIDRVADGIFRVTDAAGGYVASSSVASGAGAGGSFDLRIPTARLPRAIADLSRLAHVRERSQGSHDITAQSVSAHSRLQEARRERQSLLRQLARATTLNETASIRARLRIVGGQIAAAKSEVRRVGNRASFANVAVTLVADRSAGAATGDGGAWTPGDALRDATRVLEVTAGVAVIALAVALPLLLVAGAAWLAAHVLLRRRRERALDLA